jgi:pilus assembly protein CpaB
MRAKMILTLLFLLSVGVIAVLSLYALPQRIIIGPAGAKREALVATAPLSAGTLLRAKDVRWQPVSGAAEPDQIQRPLSAAGNTNPQLDQQARDEVYGAALRTEVPVGHPIRRSVVVKPGDRDFLRIVLSPLARAIAIPVATGGASTGLLYPGDRVDVILTQTFKNEALLTRRSVSETVVERLRVLAVDAPDAKPAGASNSFGRTVTLEVTPEQAEKINVATELGKLSLTLCSITDNDGATATLRSRIANGTRVKPTWAGDVSPALGDAVPPEKVVAVVQPPVAVIHGTKAVSVKPQ